MTSGRTAIERDYFDARPTFRWHPETNCAGETCVIHNPSSHNMRNWPLNLRETTLMERYCPHGIGHPDPDSWPALNRIVYGDANMEFGFQVHGCDGCCTRQTGTHENW